MSTYGVMQARIQDELVRPDLSANIRSSIKGAIRFYESEFFYFNDGRSTINTVTGQEYYGVPSDYIKPLTMTLTTSNYTYILSPRTHAWMEENSTNENWTGRPEAYCFFAGQVRLYPIPNASDYRLEMAYIKTLGEISATASDSATNAWMTDAEEVIRLHAKVDVMQNVIREAEVNQEAAMLVQREERIADRLRYESSSRRATGRLKPTKF